MAAFTEEQVKDFSIKNWYDLSGQVAVVTGGATGLGLAITRCLVSAGAKVAVVASRAPELVADTLAEGAFALTKAFVPQMKEQGHGRIIFQASMTSYIGQPQVAGYSTAKAGYLGLIHTLTAELAEYGITVNAIAPGWIDTPMFHKATDNDPPRLAKIMGRIPAKSVGDPMDVGMCAAFLCSDAARYISGTCIPVDGGALIGF